MRTLTTLLLYACLASQTFGQATQTKRVTSEIAEINAAMQRFVDSGDIAGAVTLVGHKGKIVHLGAVGLANIERGKEMKKFSSFAIASMTKPTIASGLMILQDEGKLSVEDKISKYIPAFADVKLSNGEAPRRELTIRDCITHTSGLVGKQIFKGSLEAAVNELATRPLAFQPGDEWQYSPGLNVAGRIIEIVARQPLQDFMKQRLFQPLGMNQTTFFPTEKQINRIATLYAPNAAKTSLVKAVGFLGDDLSMIEAPNPSGGLISNARDLFRFYQMVLNDGKHRKQQILSKDAVEQMTSPQTGDLKTGFTPGNCWGLGWCIIREPQGVTGMLSEGTFGHGGAFGTQGWVDPQTERIYVMMIQRMKLKNSDASEMRKAFQQVAVDKLN